MSKIQRYYREDGEVSKSGRTIVRTSKSGRKYYHNPTKYKEIKEAKERKMIEEGLIPTDGYEHSNQRAKPICSDPKSESYMRYFEKKSEIRGQYPNWVHMKREQYKEYYSKLWELMMHGEDFQQWLRVDSKTLAERQEDQWWEEKKIKDQNYDGRSDEY